jgi:hypothetical protein
MRRLSIYCLIGLLAFQSAGYHLAFVVENGLHKAITKAKVKRSDDEKLVLLCLSDAEFKALAWAEKDEFWYDGAMHDLKVLRKTGDGTWQLRCKRDDHETEMLRRGKEAMHVEHEDAENHPTGQLLRLFAPCVLNAKLEVPQIEVIKAEFPTFQESAKSIAREILCPPPQMG